MSGAVALIRVRLQAWIRREMMTYFAEGDRRQETEVRRKRKSGVRSQESEVRIDSEEFYTVFWILTPDFLLIF
jgi:hypothetical protein